MEKDHDRGRLARGEGENEARVLREVKPIAGALLDVPVLQIPELISENLESAGQRRQPNPVIPRARPAIDSPLTLHIEQI